MFPRHRSSGVERGRRAVIYYEKLGGFGVFIKSHTVISNSRIVSPDNEPSCLSTGVSTPADKFTGPESSAELLLGVIRWP